MPDEVVLAFDFGTQRIGVAVGATMLKSARPLTTIAAAANAARFAEIGRLIVQWQPARLVVGLPLAPDGSAHDMTARSRRFANQLHGRYALPVELVDERWTSTAATESLRGGTDLRRNKRAIDAAAAALILQSYFDHPPHADPDSRA